MARRPELIITDNVAAVAQEQLEHLQPRSIALTGGDTAERVYSDWAMGTAVAWSAMEIFWGDERCVPPDHPDSNFGMAHRTLLSKVTATRLHRMPGETCDAEAYEADLRSVFGPGIPRIDLILLGLGDDGHVASLFAGDAAMEERERLCVRVQRPDYTRLTLTFPVLNATPVAMFIVDGESKREALRQLMEGGDIPAARVQPERVLVIADTAAAGQKI
jgi:6-phosphogluconolactonase